MKVITVFVLVIAYGSKVFADQQIEFKILRNFNGPDLHICNSSAVNLTVARNDTIDVNVAGGYKIYYPKCYVDNEDSKILGFSDFGHDDKSHITYAKVKANDLKSGRWHCIFLILKNITKDVLESQRVEFEGVKYVGVNCTIWVKVEEPCDILVCQNMIYYILGGGLIALMLISETIIIIYLKCKRKKSEKLQHLQRTSSTVRYEGRYSVGPGLRKNLRQENMESLYEEVDTPEEEPKSSPQIPVSTDIRKRPPMPLPKKLDSSTRNITDDLEMESYDYIDDTSPQITNTLNRAPKIGKKPVPKIPPQLTNEKPLAPEHSLLMNELISKIGSDHGKNTARKVRSIAEKTPKAVAGSKMKPMMTDNARPITEKARPIIENGKRITENARPVTENAKPITKNARPITGKAQPITGKAQLITENERPITENVRPITENVRPITENARPITGNVRPITENKRPITENKKAITENARPIQELVRPHEMRPLLGPTRPYIVNMPLPPPPIEEQLYNEPVEDEDWNDDDDEFQAEYLEPHNMYINSVNLINRTLPR